MLEDRLFLDVTDATGPGSGQSLAADAQEKDGIARFVRPGLSIIAVYPEGALTRRAQGF